MRPKVLLGMSGGTDSSVAAILLQGQGYAVEGITFRFWDDESSLHQAEQARVVAARLGIRHEVCDVRAAFREHVIDYFTGEYLSGRTPFPCTRCNQMLKWPLLFEHAQRRDCRYVATGHYARIINQTDGTLCIGMGADADKDQSFFLWPLIGMPLDRVLFPLGGLTKTEVRRMASEHGVAVAKQKESTGLCFCVDDYRPFLEAELSRRGLALPAGNFVDEAGRVLGRHRGYAYYTVGQRRGFGLQLNKAMYVKEIRPSTGEVVLSGLQGLYRTTFGISGCRFVRTDWLDDSRLWVRIRYRKQHTACRVELLHEGRAEVVLHEPLEAIAPGQTAVLYIGVHVVGGGFID